jgi:hypothetical protein
MINDLQTKKKRLTKKKVSDHFKPELDDDTFGFNSQNYISIQEWIKCVALAMIFVSALWLVLTVLFTMTPNI